MAPGLSLPATVARHRPAYSILARRSWPAVGAAVALLASPAAAAPLGVTPTQIDLSVRQNSDLLAITNDGDDAVRLQIEVFAWEQRPDGATVLDATQDILAFPPLLAVAPHETKRIRVGAAAAPGAAEKSYRLTIQELPGAPKEGVSGVQMLTKISLPIFLQPGALKPDASIEPGAVERGRLSFAVHDSGTEHVLLRGVTVTGMSAAGATTFEAKANGWYVLAGGRRDYQLVLSRADCRASPQLVLAAELQEGKISAHLPVAPAACGDGAKTEFIASGEPGQ